jgi:hypothetical protein
MTATNYKDFPFTTNGVNFVSRIYSDSPFLSRIERLPEGVFTSMNIQAVNELVTFGSTVTLKDIQESLDHINAGGSHAFIMLGENN